MRAVIHTRHTQPPVDSPRESPRTRFSAKREKGIHSTSKPCSIHWAGRIAVFQRIHSTTTTTTFFFSLV